MISIRYEKCDPEGCGDCIRSVSFLLGAPDPFPLRTRDPRIFYPFPDGFSLFCRRSQRSARNVDSRPLFDHKFRIGVNANIQGIALLRTKNRRDLHLLPAFSLRDVSFCFAVAKSPFLFRLYRVPPKFIPPSRGSQPRFYPPATCMFAKQQKSTPPLPPRDYSSEARGIISRIKAARFGAVSSDTAGNGTAFYESELHLIYRYSANDGCKASRAPFFLIWDFPSRIWRRDACVRHSCCIFIFDRRNEKFSYQVN